MFEFVLRLRGAIGAMLAAAVVLAAAAGPSLANGEGWTVLETKGAVVVLRAEQGVVALRQGDQVAPGDRVKTGADGHVRLTQGGDFITGSPNGELEIPLAPGKDNGPDVLQRMGTFIYKMVKRPVDRFRVKTPYLTAVIKGTTFAVGVTDAGATLHVTEGAVQVRSAVTGAAALIRPGHTAVVSREATRPMRIYRPDRPKRDKESRAPAKHKHTSDSADNRGKSGGGVETGNATLRLTKTIDVGAVDVREASDGLVKGPANGGLKLAAARSKSAPAANRGVKSTGETAASPHADTRLSEIASRDTGISGGNADGPTDAHGKSGAAGGAGIANGNLGSNAGGHGGGNGNGVVNGGGNSGIKAGAGGNGSSNAGGNGSGAVKVDGKGSVIAGIGSDDNGNTGGNGNAGGNSGSSNAGGNGGGSGGAQVALTGNAGGNGNGKGNAGGNGKSNAGGNGNGGGKGKGK